jgi:ferritin
MTLGKDLEKAFNDQIHLELASSYAYLGLSAWFETQSLPGMAHWMRLQSEEEHEHAMKFYRFVVDRDGAVTLGALDGPSTSFASPLDAFEHSLAHERKVTSAINALYAKATEAQDFSSLPLLGWFVNEQVEEEATVSQIIEDLRRIGDNQHALLMLDRELGARRGEEGEG